MAEQTSERNTTLFSNHKLDLRLQQTFTLVTCLCSHKLSVLQTAHSPPRLSSFWSVKLVPAALKQKPRAADVDIFKHSHSLTDSL